MEEYNIILHGITDAERIELAIIVDPVLTLLGVAELRRQMPVQEAESNLSYFEDTFSARMDYDQTVWGLLGGTETGLSIRGTGTGQFSDSVEGYGGKATVNYQF